MPVVYRIYDPAPINAQARRSARYSICRGMLIQDYFAPTASYIRSWDSVRDWMAYRELRHAVRDWLETQGGSMCGFVVPRQSWLRCRVYVQRIVAHYDVYFCLSCRAMGANGLDEFDRCDSCTVICSSCDAICSETNDDGECYECAERSSEEHMTHRLRLDSHSYGDIANTKYNSDNDASRRYFGVELEMEYNGERDALDPRNVMSIAGVLKEDSSLHEERGAEWVSAPCSEEYWRDCMPGVESGMNRLRKNGWSSWETGRCGLHVHVTKPGTFVTAKLLTLIYSNPAIILSLSGRSTRELDQWASLSDVSLDRIVKKATGTAGDGTKYAAVNMRPAHTIELRFFRGSMLPSRLYTALEFVWAALSWVETEAGLQDASSWPMFSRFVQRHAKSYSHFLSWLQKHGHAPAPKARKEAA